MKKMNENTKVTLTFGQLRKLVKESDGEMDIDKLNDHSRVVYVVADKDSGKFIGLDGNMYGVESVLRGDDNVAFESLEEIKNEIDFNDDTGIDMFHGHNLEDLGIGEIELGVINYRPIPPREFFS